MKILVTCPPMIKQMHRYQHLFTDVYCPETVQTLTEDELVDIVHMYDGWIVGDDPVTEKVLKAGVDGILKAVVKWGVGTDNIDFEACSKLGVHVANTPAMFGREVADVAVCYLVGLSRKLFEIDRSVRSGEWFKPTGVSLYGKKVALIGFGDIGQQVAKRLLCLEMELYVSDPNFETVGGVVVSKNNNVKINSSVQNVNIVDHYTCLSEAEYVIITCSLNKSTYHMLDKHKLLLCKKGVGIVNVSRGSVVKEDDIVELLQTQHVSGLATDVFEDEPVTKDSKLLHMDNCILGSHNSSNTLEAVDRTTFKAVDTLFKLLLK